MAESKRAKGPLPGFTLDSPSILSKLINNDAMERPTGVVNESLDNFDEGDPGIFRYLLYESLKDAWDRLLRIRASYVPQYQIKIYLKSFYVGLNMSHRPLLDCVAKGNFIEIDPSIAHEIIEGIVGTLSQKGGAQPTQVETQVFGKIC